MEPTPNSRLNSMPDPFRPEGLNPLPCFCLRVVAPTPDPRDARSWRPLYERGEIHASGAVKAGTYDLAERRYGVRCTVPAPRASKSIKRNARSLERASLDSSSPQPSRAGRVRVLCTATVRVTRAKAKAEGRHPRTRPSEIERGVSEG